jgi:AcrR family transcriptional regulator
MSLSRTYHHGDLSNAALLAAENLLREEGVSAVSMREIAKRVGVTHRALYRWFPDRDAMLAALAAAGFRRLAGCVRAAASSGQPSEARSSFVRAFLQFAVQHKALYQLTMSRSRAALKRYPVLGDAAADMVAASLEVFGGIDDQPRDFVIALWSMLHGLSDLYGAGLLAIRNDDALVDYGLTLSERLTPLARPADG